MKLLLLSLSTLVFCAILLCLFAYATGNLPTPKTIENSFVPASVQQATRVESSPQCSPCVEKMTSILEIMGSEWEADMTAFLQQAAIPSEIAVSGWGGLSPEQRDKAKQLIDQYGTEEGLRRLKEMDPEAAQQFERHRLRSENPQSSEPSRNVPDGEQSEQ